MRFATILAFVLCLTALLAFPVQETNAQSSFDRWWPVPTDPWVPWLTPEDAAVGLATSSTYWQRHYRAAMWRSAIRYSFFDEVLRDVAGSPFSGRAFRLDVVESNQGLVVLPGLETRLSVGSGRARIEGSGGGEEFGWGYYAAVGFGYAPFHRGIFTPAVQPEFHGEIAGFSAGRNDGEIDELVFANLRFDLRFRFELVTGHFVDSQGSWNVWLGAGLRHCALVIDGVGFPTVTTWEWTMGTHVHIGRYMGITGSLNFPIDFWADGKVPVVTRVSFEWVFG